MQWISVKDKLPEHHQTVLCYSSKGGQAVTIFVDGAVMRSVLEANNVKSSETQAPYYFCSQEFKANVLNSITHWMPLPEPPK